MYEEKLVSVIVPIYNVEEYLERCIESILRQSYNNLEIILVDDGSTDRSGEICDAFAQKDNRVKVIHQVNGGVATARNTGLDNSKGDYICFIDSDDYVHPDFIKYLYIKLMENGCDISMCRYAVTDKGDYHKALDWNSPVTVYDRNLLFERFYSDIHCHIIMLWNKLIKRECIGDIRFDDGYINEDEGTTFRFLYNAGKIVFCEEMPYYYFSRNESITGVPYSKKRLDILRAYENRLEFYLKQGEDRYYNRECMFYLSEILTNYYKVFKYLDRDKLILRELKNKYDKAYTAADKSGWGITRRALYFVCRFRPLLYGRIKF